jgi:hypothetical protein
MTRVLELSAMREDASWVQSRLGVATTRGETVGDAVRLSLETG